MGKVVQWYNAEGLRWCSRCECYVSPDQFNSGGPNATTPDKRQIYCRYHQSQIRRAHYWRTRERNIAYTRAYRAAHPECGRTESARQAKREYKLRQALASGAFARRLHRQARDERDMAQLRKWLRDATQAHSVQDAQRLLGCSYKRSRRLYVLAGGVIGEKGAHPTTAHTSREEQAG